MGLCSVYLVKLEFGVEGLFWLEEINEFYVFLYCFVMEFSYLIFLLVRNKGVFWRVVIVLLLFIINNIIVEVN